MAKTTNMSAKNMNIISKGIKARRDSFEGIISDFRAVWAKVNRDEVKAVYAEVCEVCKADKKNEEAKALRYQVECVLAKVKALTLTEEEVAIVKEMQSAFKFGYKNISMEYIVENLKGTPYVNAEGEVCDRKKDKESGEYYYVPTERWTVAKVGRYFRLANIQVFAKAEVAKAKAELGME